MFYLPRSLVNFVSLLLPLHNFYHFPSSSTILLFSLLHLHLFIYSIYFSIHKYIDLLSTVHRPYIDPSSTLLSTFFNTASWIVKLYIPPPPPHFYCFPSTTTTPSPLPPPFYCFPSTATTTTSTATTFLLFSLHLVVVEGKQSGVGNRESTIWGNYGRYILS